MSAPTRPRLLPGWAADVAQLLPSMTTTIARAPRPIDLRSGGGRSVSIAVVRDELARVLD